MFHSRNQSIGGGGSIARPILAAMQTDNLKDLRFQNELYSDLASFESLSPQHGGGARPTQRAQYWSRACSDDEGGDRDSVLHFLSPIRGKFRRRASSFSTRVSHLTQRIRDSATVYDEDRFGRQDGCCDKDSLRECVRGAGPPFARNVISSAVIKFLFELISTRSVTKAFR